MKEDVTFFKEFIMKDPEASRMSADKVRDYIAHSTAIYHNEPIKTLHIPKIFSEEAYRYMQQAGQMTCRILDKITNRYLSDPEYRKLFPYPEGLEDLVLTDRVYDTVIPICRLDIFFNEEDFSFKFCEINTDGTSGMVEDLELNRALQYNNAHAAYAAEHELYTLELYHSFVDAFLKIYEDWIDKTGKGVHDGTAKPFVAIVDFLDGSYISDFYHFKDAFEAAGCACEICEITELRYENGVLFSPEGHPIDAIYRRAVTTDIFEHRERIVPFLDALKDKAVCCEGNFCTQVAHNKSLFHIIRLEETLSFLTEEEVQFVLDHFPFTGYLNSAGTGTELTLDDVIATKDRWIVKPLDLYGAREISVGSDLTQNEWAEKINDLKDKGYIFQEYCYPYRTENIALEEKNETFSEWINMTGLYMYAGKLAGFFSRLAPDKVIAGHYGGRTLATLVKTDRV